MTTFRSYYFDQAILDLPHVIKTARKALKDVDFDTIVGTGFSGGIVIPALAMSMDKKFVLIRKEDDDSHHGGGKLVGQLGERWIFVDDFVSSGRTRTRVVAKIAEAVADEVRPITTTFVGQYLYQNLTGFEPFEAGWR